MKSQKQYVHPWILLLWQKVCVKRYQHQFTVVLNNWTFRILIVQLSSFGSGVEANWAFIQKMAILAKKIQLFRWISFWFWRVCKQVKLSHLGHRKPARVTVWCGFWSRGRIGQFFFENEQGEAATANGDHYRAMMNEILFTKIEEEDIGNIWFQQDGATCHTAVATLDVLYPVFRDRVINCIADVVWPPRSCDLTPLDCYL